MASEIKYNSFSTLTNGFSIPSLITVPSNTALINTNTSDTFSPSERNSNNGHGKHLKRNVIYSIAALGAIALFFTKGLSGSTAKKIKSFFDTMENNLLKSSQKNGVARVVDRSIVNASKYTRRAFSLSNIIANFTALKDTGFRKLYSLDFLKFKAPNNFITKGWNGLINLPTRFFKFMTTNIMKITHKAIDSKYSRVSASLDNFIADGVKGIEKYGANSAKGAEALRILNELNPIYTQGFSKATRNGRLARLYEGLKNLASNVNNAIISPFKELGNKTVPFRQRFRNFSVRLKESYGSYITSTQANAAKTAHQNAVFSAKRKLSNNIGDVTKSLQTLANDLKHCLAANDVEGRCSIGEILSKIDKYGQLAGSTEDVARKTLRNEIIKDLDSLLKKVPEHIKKQKGDKILRYTQSEISKMTALADSMKQTMTEYSKKGKIQDFLSKMKDILPKEEYEILKARAEKLNTALNKAVEAEGNSLGDKVAESIVGSVPTDLLFQGLAIGGAAHQIMKGEDKNERIGTSLKLGLPILGGIGTYFYSASKAYSGTTNILLSIGSGIVLNKIGNSIYNYYKKRFVEKKPIKEIANETLGNTAKS
ncbi:hypothetical protein IJS77_04980 [bacterium]|nr:hypothetical protein [bacterium]